MGQPATMHALLPHDVVHHQAWVPDERRVDHCGVLQGSVSRGSSFRD